jgi:hypothetical protein
MLLCRATPVRNTEITTLPAQDVWRDFGPSTELPGQRTSITPFTKHIVGLAPALRQKLSQHRKVVLQIDDFLLKLIVHPNQGAGRPHQKRKHLYEAAMDQEEMNPSDAGVMNHFEKFLPPLSLLPTACSAGERRLSR